MANNIDINAMLAERTGIQLDIGCGANKQGPDWIGMDIQPLPGVDLIWDWNVHPWPLPNECAVRAVASHVVEHIPAVTFDGEETRLLFIEFMDEVWRILQPGGQFAIACPHGYSPGQLQDPTHCHAVNETTWAYFDPEEPHTGGMLYPFYRPKPWRVAHLSWSPAANIEVVLVKREDIYGS